MRALETLMVSAARDGDAEGDALGLIDGEFEGDELGLIDGLSDALSGIYAAD